MKSKLYNVYFSFIKDREVIYITYTVNTYSRQEAIEIARCVIAEKLEQSRKLKGRPKSEETKRKMEAEHI